MNKQKLLIVSILAVVTISMTALLTTQTYSYVYTQSDITKANPNLVMGKGSFSMVENIEHATDYVVLTLSGTVLSVGDPVDWIEKESGEKHASIPVTIEVEHKTKDTQAHLKITEGDRFTFYLGGLYENDVFYIFSYQPQFEIGEQIIVHIGISDQGVDGPNGDNHYVVVGMFGKYKVIEDKAYNEKYPTGKSLDIAFNEAK